MPSCGVTVGCIGSMALITLNRSPVFSVRPSVILPAPWRLWNLESGEPFDHADTLEMMAVLEKGMAQSAHPHPGIVHMYIHTMEMSPMPQRALRAADQLRSLAPEGGHLLHMPSHIYMQ